jgi:hypothetical protein
MPYIRECRDICEEGSSGEDKAGYDVPRDRSEIIVSKLLTAASISLKSIGFIMKLGVW